MMLSKGQREVLQDLQKTAEVALNKTRYKTLPVLPRTHALVCGPSGVGKSHLCRELGKELDVPVLVLNCSSWLVQGNRSGTYTWDGIVQFLDAHDRGIIVLDEIDKIDGNSDWVGHIRLEIHDFLDGIIPSSVSIPFDDGLGGSLWGEPVISEHRDKAKETEGGKRLILTERLKYSCLIVGAGAWQHLWQSNETQSMGFMQDSPTTGLSVPSQHQLQTSIYPEILRRFQSSIRVIPPMIREDYLEQVAAVAKTLEPGQAARLEKKAHETLEHAHKLQLGMRWLEDLILDAITNPEPIKSIPAPGSGVMDGKELFSEECLDKFERERPDSISLEDFCGGFKEI